MLWRKVDQHISIFGGTAPYTQNWFGFNNNSLSQVLMIILKIQTGVFSDSVMIMNLTQSHIQSIKVTHTCI